MFSVLVLVIHLAYVWSMHKKESISHRRQLFKQKIFLNHFRKDALLSFAAIATGITRQTVYYWLETSPRFARQMREAENEALDNIHAMCCKTLSERAREGNRQVRAFIRKEYGEEELNAVIRGKSLTLKGPNE